MWGFDFRPAYGNLGILASLNCQVIALTATCTPRTEEIILSSLNLTSVTTIRQRCDRPNISLIVKPKKGDGKEQATNMIVNEHKDNVTLCIVQKEQLPWTLPVVCKQKV
jgi:superfamily II DNA helicase RecQ